MKTGVQIKKEVVELKETVDSYVKKYLENHKNLEQDITNASSVEEGFNVVNTIVNSIDSFYNISTVNGYTLPKHLIRLSFIEGDLTSISLTIRTKLKASFSYAKKVNLSVKDNIIDNIIKAFDDACFEMYNIEQATNNLNELNTVIANICKESEIPYTFGFTVTGGGSSIVDSISDDSIIFNASITNALDVANLSICRSGDEYSDYVRDEAISRLVAQLRTIPTTVQLIKSKIQIISDVVGVTTKKHASKIIRGAYHKNARYIGKQKAGVAYYNEKVDINGEQVDVFSIIEKNADGTYAVLLKPFDTKTLFNVEFDVIAAVKEFA